MSRRTWRTETPSPWAAWDAVSFPLAASWTRSILNQSLSVTRFPSFTRVTLSLIIQR